IMPALEDFLFAWMKQEPDVTAIIGTGDNCAFYPQHGVQNRDEFPRVTYLIVVDAPKHYLKGRVGTDTASVQIDCWARGPGGESTANDLAIAIHGTSEDQKLDGYRGTLASTFVHCCLMRPGKQQFEEEPEDGSDEWIYRVMMTFDI